MNKSAFIDWYKWTSIENLYFVFKGLSLLTAEIIKKKVFTKLSSKSKSGKA